MNQRGGAAQDRAELVKWWDILDAHSEDTCQNTVRRARENRHPDAVWLASLFPGDISELGWRQVRAVLEAQGSDARALFLVAPLEAAGALWRAAELGYAPAQAAMALEDVSRMAKFEWAEKAAAQGDRLGLRLLGEFLRDGVGCARDEAKSVAALTEAAELGDGNAQFVLGCDLAPRDWRRYRWWGPVGRQGLLQGPAETDRCGAGTAVAARSGPGLAARALRAGRGVQGAIQAQERERSRVSFDEVRATGNGAVRGDARRGRVAREGCRRVLDRGGATTRRGEGHAAADCAAAAGRSVGMVRTVSCD